MLSQKIVLLHKQLVSSDIFIYAKSVFNLPFSDTINKSLSPSYQKMETKKLYSFIYHYTFKSSYFIEKYK